MKKKSVWALALAAMLMWVGKPAAAAVNESFDPVEYVNPLMGTQSSYELSTGNTYPAIARPWGMNFWHYTNIGANLTKRIRKKKSNEPDHTLFIALLSLSKKIKYHMLVPYELCPSITIKIT